VWQSLSSDGEISAHRIFKDLKKAEKYAERQEKSKVVKSAKIVPVGTGSVDV